MDEYQNLVRNVLQNGTKEKNRTKEDTIASFGYNYNIDVGEGYPLLTTKKMDTFRWDSMLYELEWYLSGKHHIRDLTEETGIWDAWADEDYNLPSAYGRFWRRYPVPEQKAQLPGEDWIRPDNEWTNYETPINVQFAFGAGEDDVINKTVNRLQRLGNSLDDIKFYLDKPNKTETEDYTRVDITITVQGENKNDIEYTKEQLVENVNPYGIDVGESYLTFDQLDFVVDALRNKNNIRGPESRRLIVQAWHPSNAQVSTLPPCHYSYLFNVQDDAVNLHLTQRSADIALGVPFNIAAYSLLLKLVSQQTQHNVGHFNHTLVDAHIYCGRDDRAGWYDENLSELQNKVENVDNHEQFKDIQDWVLNNAPEEETEVSPSEGVFGYDHVPGLLEQLTRQPKGRSNLNINPESTINNLSYEDIDLNGYESYDGLRFEVAE